MDKKEERIMSESQDITINGKVQEKSVSRKRKSSEVTLRQGLPAMLTQDMLKSLPEPLIVIDRNRKILKINKAMEELTGYKESEAVGVACSEICPMRVCSENCVYLQMKKSNRSVRDIDSVMKTRSDKEIHVSVAMGELRDEDGLIIGGIELIRDLSEHKKKMLDLSDAHHKASQISASISLPVIVVDTDLNVTFINDATSRLFSVSPHQAMKMKCSELFRGEMCAQSTCLIKKALKIGEAITGVEVRVITRDGKELDLTVDAVPLKDSKGILTGGLEILKDVTDERKLMRSVLEIAFKVAATAENLASATEQMNATTEQVSSSMVQISQGAHTQVKRVDETTRIIDEMSSITQEVGQNAQFAGETSKQASDVAKKGSSDALIAVDKMRQIQDVVVDAGEVVKRAGDSSKQIEVIVDLIINIAQQTNLLAFNAKIEAARAGEGGRGFMVVADEVSKLAESSRKAADRISELIQRIRDETSKAVESTENGVKEVNEGALIISRTLKSLEEVYNTVQNTATMVNTITGSSQKLRSSTENVVKAVDEVARIAEQTSSSTEQTSASTEELTASMEELTASAQELADMAQELKESMTNFGLDMSKETQSAPKKIEEPKKKGQQAKNPPENSSRK